MSTNDVIQSLMKVVRADAEERAYDGDIWWYDGQHFSHATERATTEFADALDRAIEAKVRAVLDEVLKK